MFRAIIALALLGTFSAVASAREAVFEGGWRTTNRPLDGTMTCKVTRLDAEQWRGRFYGVWQGVPFDYTVTFSGPPSDLTGTATIDGAEYAWSGSLERSGRFWGKFGGTRYEGQFDLQKKKSATPKSQP